MYNKIIILYNKLLQKYTDTSVLCMDGMNICALDMPLGQYTNAYAVKQIH